MIVEVEEETTSELGRQGPGAKRKKRSNADLKGALVGSYLPLMVTSAVLSHPKSVREQFRGFMFMLRD